jgi:hypothetical protein
MSWCEKMSLETVPGLMTPGHLMAHGTRQAPSKFVSFSREEPASEQRFQSNQSNLSLLPPECRCKEKGMLSATKNHLAKELFHDTSSTSHDRGHVGAPGVKPMLKYSSKPCRFAALTGPCRRKAMRHHHHGLGGPFWLVPVGDGPGRLLVNFRSASTGGGSKNSLNSAPLPIARSISCTVKCTPTIKPMSSTRPRK